MNNKKLISLQRFHLYINSKRVSQPERVVDRENVTLYQVSLEVLYSGKYDKSKPGVGSIIRGMRIDISRGN